jgi:hydroxymethylpyrimidine pyrophosphatase-like HAD family hydrolase
MSGKHSTKRLPVLATDLDGTFLEGPEVDRQALRRLFSEAKGASLIFVSGRGLSSIEALLDVDPLLPIPLYIIGDVGATVVRGDSLRPVQPLQDDIAARWSGAEVVREALRPFKGLAPQDVPQERRCSFFVDANRVTDDLYDAIESIGCELLFSNGRYLDILPRGVSKGETLQKLVVLEDLDPSSVVVAGDTLNDLSLFKTGLKGIVVGNAEPALLENVTSFEWVYRASEPGVSGICEGLRYHGFQTVDRRLGSR